MFHILSMLQILTFITVPSVKILTNSVCYIEKYKVFTYKMFCRKIVILQKTDFLCCHRLVNVL